MHPCLKVQELLHLICEQVCPYYKYCDIRFVDPRRPPEGLTTLAALAQTCKTFQIPAVNLLWYYQFGFANLVKCLPSDLWRIRRIADRDHLEFVRPVTAEDWKQFDSYAVFVRKFEYIDALDHDLAYWGPELCDTVWEALGSRPSPVLPNLKEVCWTAVPAQTRLHNLHALIPPEIRTLFLRCTLAGPNDTFDTIFTDLCARYPAITDLSVMVGPGISIDSILDSLDQLSNLQHIRFASTVSALTPRRLRLLSSIPDLQELMFTGPISDEFRDLCDAGDIVPFLFARLESLMVASRTPDNSLLTSLQDLCVFPALKAIAIHSIDLLGVSTSSSVASATAPLDLETFALIEGDSALRVDTIAPVALLRPMERFINLRDIMLVMKGCLSINDKGMEWLARTFPDLRHLHLRGRSKKPDGVEIERPSLLGLACLVRHCPGLIAFNVALDAARPLPDNVLDNLPVSNQEVSLYLAHSTLGRTRFVSKLLARMFPKLKMVYGYATGLTEPYANLPELLDSVVSAHVWKAVDNIVKDIHGLEEE